MMRSAKNIVIIVVLLLTITGGVFITSTLFKEVENTPKKYFIIISMAILLVVCMMRRRGFQGFMESLQSRTLLNGIVIVCFLATIHGLLQFFNCISSNHSAFPITGTFENPAGFAAVQAALYPFVVTRLFDGENSRLMRLFSVAVSVICFISVVLSGSRAGILALFSVLIVVLAYNDVIASFFKSHKWLCLPIIIIIVSLLIVLYYVKQDSADGRIFIWNRCFEMIKKRPLLGYGVYGFHHYYMSAQADFFRIHPDSPFIMLADNVGHPFNEYIKLIIHFGIVGLFVALGLIVWIVWKLYRTEKQIKVLGLSYVASLFIMCQFSYPFHYSVVWLLGFIAIIPALIRPLEEIYKVPGWIRIGASTLLLLFFSFTLRRMYYDMKWSEISNRALIGQTKQMLKYYEGMPSSMKHNPPFLYNYAAELNYSGKYEESLSLTKQCEEMWNDYDVQMLKANNYANIHDKENAIQSYDKAANMIPCRFEPLLGKMLVYMDANDTVNVLCVANEINEKPIKVRSDRISFIIERSQQILSYYNQ